MTEYNYEKERNEAIEAGERALDSLYAAKEQLDSAKNWGIVDLFGGGFITNIVKHSKMSNAQEYMERAKRDLQIFSHELNDVSTRINLDFDVSDFLGFADFFFDGLIADWLVQDKINNARHQVERAIDMVEDVLDRI